MQEWRPVQEAEAAERREMKEQGSASVDSAMTSEAKAADEGPSRGGVLLNFAAFQLGWFACALTAGAGFPSAGIAIVAGLVALHLMFCGERAGEAGLIGAVTVLGGAIDTAQWWLGVSIAPVDALPGAIAPLWFAAMYANFATTLRYSLAWLGKRLWLAAAFGATGGPLTYRAGAGFGAIEIVDPAWRSLAVLGLVWGVLTPALFVLERKLRAFSIQRAEAAWAPGPRKKRE